MEREIALFFIKKPDFRTVIIALDKEKLMASVLNVFEPKSKILASKVNENFELVQTDISEMGQTLNRYVEGEIASVQSNLSSVQATLQENIEASFKGRVFVEKVLNIGIGTTSLSSYLPNDGFSYLVWVAALRDAKNADTLYASTDVLTHGVLLLALDGDAGRSSRSVFFGALPVGPGRKIVTSGSANALTLYGYAKL